MRGDVDPFDAGFLHDFENRLEKDLDGQRPLGAGRTPGARQVERNALVARERGAQRCPGIAGAPEAMDEQHRLARADDLVGNAFDECQDRFLLQDAAPRWRF
jgi:hypothetical protein